jgi:hypothetical protein
MGGRSFRCLPTFFGPGAVKLDHDNHHRWFHVYGWEEKKKGSGTLVRNHAISEKCHLACFVRLNPLALAYGQVPQVTRSVGKRNPP